MICSRRFQNAVCRAGRSVTVTSAIVVALFLPYPAGAQGGFNGPGRYEITNSKFGKVFDLDLNDQTRLMQFSWRGTDNQAGEIQAAGGGLFSLRNGMNGNALEAVGNSNATPVRATRYDGRSSQQWQGPDFGQGGMPAEEATDQLIQDLCQSNQNMRVFRGHEPIDFGGQHGLSTYLSNDSPIQGGGRETNWLVTLPRPQGLLFFVFTAPEREFQGYERAFQQMPYSVRVKQ